MKIFLEGNRPQFSSALKRTLVPGINDVPDEVAIPLLKSAEDEAKRIREDRKKRKLPDDDVKPLFRSASHDKAASPEKSPSRSSKKEKKG